MDKKERPEGSSRTAFFRHVHYLSSQAPELLLRKRFLVCSVRLPDTLQGKEARQLEY